MRRQQRNIIVIFGVVLGVILLYIGMYHRDKLQQIVTQQSVSQKEETKEISTNDANDFTDNKKQWEEAKNTPYGKYPELVTYTLGKIIGDNNSNLPILETYENNGYTRYLRKKLNIQNQNVIELEDSLSYEEAVEIAISDNDLPDILVVKGRKTLKKLVSLGLVEDLTNVYETCTTDRIKEMYESHGSSVLGSATFQGKLYAFPDTAVDNGVSLLWLRKDWMNELGLKDPTTLEEGMEIVNQFLLHDMAGNNETVGLVCSTDLVSENGGTYGLDAIFDWFLSSPRRWRLQENGQVVYGSLMEETKEALSYLNQLYEANILDTKFLFRTKENIDDLIAEGKSGAMFGYWWAPNNPLNTTLQKDRDAIWQPYLLTGNRGTSMKTFEFYEDCLYVVVRKGYEHPEIVGKYVSMLFDYARYEDTSDASEINTYFSLNVDPTARPFNINVDYWDAIYRVQDNMEKVFHGEKQITELNGLERAYYNTCKAYVDGTLTTANGWAAYASRLQVTRLLKDTLHTVLDIRTMGEDEPELSQRLLDLEKNTFLQMIIGEKEIDEFDSFVEQWYQQGGDIITRKAQTSYEK